MDKQTYRALRRVLAYLTDDEARLPGEPRLQRRPCASELGHRQQAAAAIMMMRPALCGAGRWHRYPLSASAENLGALV
jgi:hypothetical protein